MKEEDGAESSPLRGMHPLIAERQNDGVDGEVKAPNTQPGTGTRYVTFGKCL